MTGVVATLSVVSAFAQPAESTAWKLVDPDAKVVSASPGRGVVVVIRKSPVPDGNVNVFFDGNYHASLPQPSWTDLQLCPGAHGIDTQPDTKALGVHEAIMAGQRFDVAPGQVSYFLVDAAPAALPVVLDAAQAQQALARMPRAAHTISRVPQAECPPPVVAVAPPPAPRPQDPPPPPQKRSFRLAASSLFAYDQYRLDAMRDEGRKSLDRIVDVIADTDVEQIEILGYADPTGTAEYNKALSLKRATAVGQYFTNAGYSPDKIKARGMGASDLVVPDCAKRFKALVQVKACDEPNRRVEVVVHGSK